MASARRTRESLRKSRASLYALRQDAEQTLRDARTLRREMQELLMDSNTFQGHSTALASSVYESDQESDSGVLSHPTVHSGMSDMTFDY